MTLAPTTRRRPYAPRLPLSERREQLLDAALAVIDERGYRGVTIDAIAREAQVSRPVVYDAFGDLTELLKALLSREEQRALTLLGGLLSPSALKASRPADMLADGLANFAREVAADPRPWRLMLLTPAGTPEEVRQHVENGRRVVASRTEELVRWGAEQVGLRDVDAELVAHALIGVGEQVARLSLADPERYSPERIGRLGRMFAERLIGEPVAGVSVAGDEDGEKRGGGA